MNHLFEVKGFWITLRVKKLKDEFGAVSVIKDGILIEWDLLVGGNGVGWAIELGIGDFFANDVFAHAFHDVDKTCSTAIDDAGLFEDRLSIRVSVEGKPHLTEKVFE